MNKYTVYFFNKQIRGYPQIPSNYLTALAGKRQKEGSFLDIYTGRWVPVLLPFNI